jgi:uncharacterized membrane protein
MDKKVVGYIIIGFSLIMGFVVWLFNRALSQIVNESCSHGPTCPMWGSISFHTNLSIGIIVLVALAGIYMVFSQPSGGDKSLIGREGNTGIRYNNIKKKDLRNITKNLDKDQEKILDMLIESQGTLFQSELVDNTGYTKVKITRILDKLEGKGLIERRRRGMTNVVILKHQK